MKPNHTRWTTNLNCKWPTLKWFWSESGWASKNFRLVCFSRGGKLCIMRSVYTMYYIITGMFIEKLGTKAQTNPPLNSMWKSKSRPEYDLILKKPQPNFSSVGLCHVDSNLVLTQVALLWGTTSKETQELPKLDLSTISSHHVKQIQKSQQDKDCKYGLHPKKIRESDQIHH